MTKQSNVGAPGRDKQRYRLISNTLTEIRKIAQEDMNRKILENIRREMEALTSHADLFQSTDFPMPNDNKPSTIYLLSEDANQEFALYLVTGDKRVRSPAHNHHTWAVIAGIAGDEENTLYSRGIAKTGSKQSLIEEDGIQVISSGDSIAFMPEDIHSIRVTSEEPSRHFHLYGVSFAKQVGRLGYDLESGKTYQMPSNNMRVDTSRRIVL